MYVVVRRRITDLPISTNKMVINFNVKKNETILLGNKSDNEIDGWLLKKKGHGSAHNSFRADDDIHVTEITPLVRFPGYRQPSPWRTRTSLAFGLLMTLLVLGSIIGIYLLYLQSLSDNVLPPVDTPLLLVPREEWCNTPPSTILSVLPKLTNVPSKHVVVVQTGTLSCENSTTCSELLKALQDKNGTPLQYNFLISSNGVTYEGLGWDAQSPLFPQLSPIVVAFIGNFTQDAPTASQIEEAFTLFEASRSEGYLSRDFTIVGKATVADQVPVYLFHSLQNITQWDSLLSDGYSLDLNDRGQERTAG